MPKMLPFPLLAISRSLMILWERNKAQLRNCLDTLNLLRETTKLYNQLGKSP